MDQNRTTRQLFMSLIMGIILLGLSIFKLYSAMQWNVPLFLPYVIFVAILVLAVVLVVTGLDLILRDKKETVCTLVEKKHNKCIATDEEKPHKTKTFRLPNDMFQHLPEGSKVEICYYRRTKAVISIKPCSDNDSESSENLQ